MKIMNVASPINIELTNDEFDETILSELGSHGVDLFIAAIQRLLERPWFFRVWVIQEVVMA